MAHRHRPPARSDPWHSPFAGARRQEQALGRFQASGSVGDCAIERALAGSSTCVAHRRSDMVRSGSNRVLDPLAAWSEQVLMAWRARDNRANGVPDDCRRELLAGKTRSSCAILSVKQERAIVLATKPSIP